MFVSTVERTCKYTLRIMVLFSSDTLKIEAASAINWVNSYHTSGLRKGISSWVSLFDVIKGYFDSKVVDNEFHWKARSDNAWIFQVVTANYSNSRAKKPHLLVTPWGIYRRDATTNFLLSYPYCFEFPGFKVHAVIRTNTCSGWKTCDRGAMKWNDMLSWRRVKFLR